MKEAQRTGRFSVDLYTTGGYASDLSGIVTADLTNFDSIKKIIKEYLENNTISIKAIPIEYSSTSLLGMFDEPDPFELYRPLKDYQFKKYMMYKEMALSYMNRISHFLKYMDAYDIPTNDIHKLKVINEKIDEYIEKLNLKAMNLLTYAPVEESYDFSKYRFTDFDIVAAFKEINSIQESQFYNYYEVNSVIKNIQGNRKVVGDRVFLSPLFIDFHLPFDFGFGKINVFNKSGKKISSVNIDIKNLNSVESASLDLPIFNIFHGFVTVGSKIMRKYQPYENYFSYPPHDNELHICNRHSWPNYRRDKCKKHYLGKLKEAQEERRKDISKPFEFELILKEKYTNQEFSQKAKIN